MRSMPQAWGLTACAAVFSWHIMNEAQLPCDSTLLSSSLQIQAAFHQDVRQVMLGVGSGVCVLPWFSAPWEFGCRGYHGRATWHLWVKLTSPPIHTPSPGLLSAANQVRASLFSTLNLGTQCGWRRGL